MEQTAGKMQMAINLLAMLLPVSASGSVEHSRGSSLSESRVLHDYAFEVPESGFVLMRGVAHILDYETLRHIAENFDKLDDFFNSEDSQQQRKKRHKENEQFRESSVLFETFFKDAIRVKIINAQGCGFIGPLAREHLREDIRGLIYKHGSRPKGEWTMLAEISRIPLPCEASEDMMAQLTEVGGSRSNQLDELLTVLNAFQEFMGSASYPDISVSPVAVYREITLGSRT